MCQSITKISETHFGQLTKCTSCNLYNLTYNNILFEFTSSEFESFKDFLKTIKPETWEKKYKMAYKKRSIPINTFQENLFLMFSGDEINDLKKLVNLTNDLETFEILSFGKINYKLQLN